MGKQKNNIVSLSAYRKKKRKLNSKKTKKAASDESVFFSDHGELFDDGSKDFKDDRGVEEGKIYYMSNYRKAKHFSQLEEQNSPEEKQKEILQKKQTRHSRRKYAKIIDLLKYKSKRPISSSASGIGENITYFENSEPVSLEDYRKNKNLQKAEKKANSLYLPKQVVKEALSFTAVALVMLFALNIFFPSEGFLNFKTDTLHYAENIDVSKDSFLTERGLASSDFIRGEKPDKGDSKASRGLSSLLGGRSLKDSYNSTQYIQKIKSEKFKDQQVIVGKKPGSSDYKGF